VTVTCLPGGTQFTFETPDPESNVAGDFDVHRHLDLVLAHESGEVSVLINQAP
jgi:hypothetical protein